jgi:hypothetical protein
MDFDGRLDLTAAVRERDAVKRRYEEVVGSFEELEVYVELNAANLRVKAIDRYLSWSEESPLGGQVNPAEEELESYVWAVR